MTWTRHLSPPGPRCRGCWNGVGAASSTWAACKRTRDGTAARTFPPPRWGWWDSRGRWPRSLAPSGIRVNCVVPGMIDTSRDGDNAPRTGNRLADIPAGRMGSTDDIANLCLFLCTDAGDYISGQTIHVNGGERNFGG